MSEPELEPVNDGGPAFPSQAIDYNESTRQNRTVIFDVFPGMSVRDVFAAKAMQGILSALPWRDEWNGALVFKVVSHIGEASYVIADAMIKARDE